MIFHYRHPACFLTLLLILSFQPVDLFAGEWTPQRLLQFTRDGCHAWASSSGNILVTSEKSDIILRGRQFGTKHRLTFEHDAVVELDVIHPTGRATRFVSKLFDVADNPQVLISLRPDCSLQQARRVNYNHRRQVISIESLDENLTVRGEPEWVNRPLEFNPQPSKDERKKGGFSPVRVGMVDSGVNYLLPVINRRLARDSENQLIGYDFWDMDNLPYDAHLINSGFFVQRHGTRTASLLLHEAPDIDLVPYRYPGADMARMKALVEHADSHQVAVIGMPLGSNQAQEWSSFERAAKAHPHILFIVSAGNNGRDIDKVPVYPAALDIDNMLVVTSADDFVRPAERTNWGKISVDYLVPAERVTAVDYSGDSVKVSGSSYAVSRVTALAARIKGDNPNWNAKQIIAHIRSRFGETHGRVLEWVSSGYIGDPAGGAAIRKTLLPSLNLRRAKVESGAKLSLDILRLDASWSTETIRQTVQTAYDILSQCDVTMEEVSLHDVEGSDYLKDLSTGNARTLLGDAGRTDPVIVFARDTRMQTEYLGEAFGIGNTRSRPWLANSVWLMLGVNDAGIALAHELYHVLANNGDHVVEAENLMQADTRSENVKLSADQCRLAYANGKGNGLLRD